MSHTSRQCNFVVWFSKHTPHPNMNSIHDFKSTTGATKSTKCENHITATQEKSCGRVGNSIQSASSSIRTDGCSRIIRNHVEWVFFQWRGWDLEILENAATVDMSCVFRGPEKLKLVSILVFSCSSQVQGAFLYRHGAYVHLGYWHTKTFI